MNLTRKFFFSPFRSIKNKIKYQIVQSTWRRQRLGRSLLFLCLFLRRKKELKKNMSLSNTAIDPDFMKRRKSLVPGDVVVIEDSVEIVQRSNLNKSGERNT